MKTTEVTSREYFSVLIGFGVGLVVSILILFIVPPYEDLSIQEAVIGVAINSWVGAYVGWTRELIPNRLVYCTGSAISLGCLFGAVGAPWGHSATQGWPQGAVLGFMAGGLIGFLLGGILGLVIPYDTYGYPRFPDFIMRVTGSAVIGTFGTVALGLVFGACFAWNLFFIMPIGGIVGIITSVITNLLDRSR